MGQPGDALAAHREALALREDLAKRFPGDTRSRLDLARSRQLIQEIEDFPTAVASQHEHMLHVLPVLRQSLSAEPDNLQRQRDLLGALQRLAQTGNVRGLHAEALAYLAESRPLEQRLLRSDPHNAVLQEDVAVSESMRGEALLATGDAGGAVAAYERSLALRRGVAAMEGQTAGQRRLADVLGKLAGAYRAASRHDDAVAAAREAADLYERRWRARPTESNRQPLRAALDLLADACAAAGRADEAQAARARRATHGDASPTSNPSDRSARSSPPAG
jgi:tetratricopeptide (TPR) repeat protein